MVSRANNTDEETERSGERFLCLADREEQGGIRERAQRSDRRSGEVPDVGRRIQALTKRSPVRHSGSTHVPRG